MSGKEICVRVIARSWWRIRLRFSERPGNPAAAHAAGAQAPGVPHGGRATSPTLVFVSEISAGFVCAEPSADVAGYLARLGLERPSCPDAAWLVAAHRAHMERVPYENLEFQLGRATSVDPVESIARIVRGRGGYCFHLNGAFGTLLAAVGYDVTRHRGQVLGPGEEPDGAEVDVNHQALIVSCDGVRYFVDCGLGDALYEPIPLADGCARHSLQPPFTYRLEPWAACEGGWRFVHDPAAGSFASMVFAPQPVGPGAFAGAHRHLSTSPESGLVCNAVAARCTAAGSEVLRGRVLTTVTAAGAARRVIDARCEWYEVLADVFGLSLPDLDAPGRARLWERVSAAHAAWLAHLAARDERRAGQAPAAPSTS
jgi:N-hydroxyarylamine O-acetyltransferase